MMGNLLSRALTFAVLLLSISVIAIAQGTTTRLAGTVTDSSGAAVPGATVTLTNEGNQVVVATVTTSGSGSMRN